jgi:hypothetical protein
MAGVLGRMFWDHRLCTRGAQSVCSSSTPLLQVNVGLTLLTLLTFIHPLHVHLHCRSLASQRRARTEQEVTNSGSEVTCNRLVGM